MSAAAHTLSESQFFAPANADMVDGLIGRYRSERERMERVVDYLAGDDFRAVVGYFESAARREGHGMTYTPPPMRQHQHKDPAHRYACHNKPGDNITRYHAPDGWSSFGKRQLREVTTEWLPVLCGHSYRKNDPACKGCRRAEK